MEAATLDYIFLWQCSGSSASSRCNAVFIFCLRFQYLHALRISVLYCTCLCSRSSTLNIIHPSGLPPDRLFFPEAAVNMAGKVAFPCAVVSHLHETLTRCSGALCASEVLHPLAPTSLLRHLSCVPQEQPCVCGGGVRGMV